MQAQRYFDILTYQNQFFPNKRALGHLKAGKKINFSSQEIAMYVGNMACNLIDKGLKKGDYVCLFGPTTDVWWVLAELAISSAGGVVVPIEITNENLVETINLLRDTQSKFCFTFAQEIQFYIQDFEEQISTLKGIFNFDKQFVTIEKHALFNNPSPESQITLETMKGVIHEDDLAFLLYTRGTTAKPKGILLSHKNILENAQAMLKLSPLNCDHRHLSITHISHSFERVVLTAVMLSGASSFFQSGVENFYFATKRIKPHFLSMSTEDCLLFLKKLTDESKKGKQSNPALDMVMRICKKNLETFTVGFWDWIIIKFIDLTLFKAWRKKLGNKLQAIYVIGSPLDSLSAKFFHHAGIEIKEGYGLTEATALVSLNGYADDTTRPKTSGKIMHNLKVRIATKKNQEYGEILVKGPSVMRSYFTGIEEQPGLTEKQEWLSTGDVGKIVDDNFLIIAPRD
ncbi:MAG: AMP-binding protein [Saprospiraceae bacterium]|nr:AMP-binding protein [Saprospiraceae bacterium]